MSDKLYTTDSASQMLGYKNGASVRKLLERNQLRGIKFGHIWMIDQKAITAYLKTRGKNGKKKKASRLGQGKE